MPCMRTGCTGLMQFGREPERASAGRRSNGGVRGWVCTLSPEHFMTTAAASDGRGASGNGERP